MYTERKRRRIYLLRKKRKEKKRREQKGLLAAAAAAPKSNMLPRSSAGFIYILILASFSIAVIQTRIKIRVSALLFCLEEEEPARDRDAGAWCD